jgi:AraC-like DNA-binding protein
MSMEDPFAPWSIAVSGFGAALGVFFAAALMLRRPKAPADPLLAAFCACFAVLMASDVLGVVLAAKNWMPLGSAFDWVFLLLAPQFYFYVSTAVSGEQPAARRWALSLLPAGLCLFWFAARWVQTAAQPSLLAEATEFMPAAYTFAFVATAVVQLFAYGVLAYRAVRDHAHAVEQQFSSAKQRDLRWVQSLLWSAAAAALVWTVGIFTPHPAWALLGTLLPPLLFLALGVQAMRQLPLPAPEPSSKYAKSGLTDERVKALAEQLSEFMAREKPFLEGDLTLAQLANRCGLLPHQLSQVLNQHLGCSFFDYINKLRVEEAKRCLTDSAYRGQTVLELGLASGFNSKAAFNAAFKRVTGLTPSQYRSQVG